MSDRERPLREKLADIKAKVARGYGFSDLSRETRECMMLAVRPIVEDYFTVLRTDEVQERLAAEEGD